METLDQTVSHHELLRRYPEQMFTPDY